MIPRRPRNGGFPLPPDGEPVRLIHTRHEACGADVRVRLPGDLPLRAVRRVVCDRCSEPFEASDVEEVEERAEVQATARAEEAAPEPKRRRELPRLWRYARVVVAGGAVVVALLAIENSRNSSSTSSSPANPAAAAPATAGKARDGGAAPAPEPRLVHGDSFALALPGGWQQSAPPSGAAFAARARDHGADATLWIERDPSLDFSTFEARSLAQLRGLAGNAHVASEVPAPTEDATVVTLTADTAADQPQYEVTLRVSGPYRYYLATTVQPEASSAAASGAELIHNSFLPQGSATAGAGD